MGPVTKAKQAPAVSGSGPVRFYIVHGFAGWGEITPSEYVRTSPFTSLEQDWRTAMPEMARKYPGRGESLEIDCHGAPGILYLDPQLNLDSLPAFLLQPYATIEFLACKVANYDVSALIQHFQSSPGRQGDMAFLRAWLKNAHDLKSEEGQVFEEDGMTYESGRLKQARDIGYRSWAFQYSCPYNVGTAEAAAWKSGNDDARAEGSRGARMLISRGAGREEALRANRDHGRVARLAIESGTYSLGDCYNGPLFCSRAARLLRCKIRAAMSSQPGAMTSGMGLDEFLRTPGYQTMPIGSWLGHVFDFSPSGSVSYEGLDVARGTYVPFTPGGDGPLRNA